MDLPTREQLIELCDRGLVPEDKWLDRDTAGAQMQLGKLRVLLLAGCEFRILTTGNLTSDEKTWWVEVTFRGFNYVEVGDMDEDTFYVPTGERLTARAGQDWY